MENKKILLCIVFIFFFKSTIYGNEELINNEIVDDYLTTYNFEESEGIIKENSSFNNFSIKEIIISVVTGDINLTINSIVKLLLNLILSEVFAHSDIIRNIILLGICSAFLKTLTDSFKFNSVGKLGFYVMYILIIFFLISSFQLAYSYVVELISEISRFILSSIPLMLSSLVFSGNTNTAFITQPIFLTLSYILMNVIKNILLPFINLIFIAEIFNNISDKQILKGFIQTSKKIIKFCIKFMLYAFLTVVSIFRIASPVSDGLLKKVFQSSVNFIPVVGSSLSGAVDTVYYFSSAIKSGLSVALIVGAFILSSVYVIKIFSLQIVYYYVSVVIEPICDKKISNTFNSLKENLGFILAIISNSLFMFIISIMLILTV